MSVYQDAIQLTKSVVNQRARIFRNQVVLVVVIAFCSIGGAIALRQPGPLSGLLALVPVCGLYLWFDARQVARWRADSLSMWAKRDIDLLPFSHAVRANPILPRATIDSMLDSLATMQVGLLESRASAQTRQAVAKVAAIADALDLGQFAAKIGITAIVSTIAFWAAATRTWMPLCLAVAILFLPLILWRLRTVFQRKSRDSLRAASLHPDFDADIFCQLIDRLPLVPTTAYLLSRDCQALRRNEYSP